jgi:hypothetical protein
MFGDRGTLPDKKKDSGQQGSRDIGEARAREPIESQLMGKDGGKLPRRHNNGTSGHLEGKGWYHKMVL